MSPSVNEMIRRARKHAENGDAVEARRLYEKVLERFPGNRRATEGLAAIGVAKSAKAGRGMPPGMAPKEAVDPLIATLNAGRFAEVIGTGDALIKRYPKTAVLYAITGVALAQTERFSEAIERYRKALAINANDPNVLNNLGIACNELCRYDAAIGHFEKAVRLAPRFVMAWANLANALHLSGRSDEALAAYDKALETDPGFVDGRIAKGIALQNMGRFADALESFAEAARRQPKAGLAHLHYSLLHRYENGEDPHLETMRAIEGASTPPPQEAEPLHFALGKAQDDLGSYEEAFGHFTKANKARLAVQPFAMEAALEQMDQIRHAFGHTPEPLERGDTSGPQPVFIVSLPRSGSTLVERILGAHSQVTACGELEAMRRIGDQTDWANFEPDEKRLRAVREAYLGALPEWVDKTPFFTDKMPVNFRFVPLILAALPEAKVIHVRRDPFATCWSMYRYRFAGGGNGFSCDLGTVARYYRAYDEHMAFCKAHYGDRVLEVVYETLTENQEAESRRLVDHLGLDWEAACLEFHTSKDIVRTTSLQQVRSKIYTGSSEAWRNYELWLGELIKGLR